MGYEQDEVTIFKQGDRLRGERRFSRPLKLVVINPDYRVDVDPAKPYVLMGKMTGKGLQIEGTLSVREDLLLAAIASGSRKKIRGYRMSLEIDEELGGSSEPVGGIIHRVGERIARTMEMIKSRK